MPSHTCSQERKRSSVARASSSCVSQNHGEKSFKLIGKTPTGKSPCVPYCLARSVFTNVTSGTITFALTLRLRRNGRKTAQSRVSMAGCDKPMT